MFSKFIAFGFVATAYFIGPKPAYAVSIEDRAKDSTVNVHYTTTMAAAVSTQTAVLVKLSDTTNWPHKNTGTLFLTAAYIEVDKVASSTITVKLGVVNAVNFSTGSVTWFEVLDSSISVSNNLNERVFMADNQYRNLKVVQPVPNTGVDGTTPFLLSNDKTSGSTVFNTTVTVSSPLSAGSVCNLGDIVMSISKTNLAAATITVDLMYSVEPY